MKKEVPHLSETLLSTYDTIQYQNPDVLLVFMRRENRQNCIRKKGLQHSVTTNIVLVSCNTLHSNVVPQPVGHVGLAEREGLVCDVRYRESELPLFTFNGSMSS
jgi:hypothetical protein